MSRHRSASGSGRFPLEWVTSVVVSAVKACAVLQSVCEVTGEQLNTQHRLIQEILLYEFELGDTAIEATQTIKHCQA